ncbi:MAG: hypothetical protein V1839_00070 [archaeon]
MLAMMNDLVVFGKRMREGEKNFTEAASDYLDGLVKQVREYGLDDVYLSDMSYLESKDGCVSTVMESAYITKDGIKLEDGILGANDFMKKTFVRMISTNYVGRARTSEVISDLQKAGDTIEKLISEKKTKQQKSEAPESTDELMVKIRSYLK